MSTKEEFELCFAKALAASCKHFNQNITCSKKPKNFMGMFSQTCSLHEGDACDAYNITPETDLDRSLMDAKLRQKQHKDEKDKL